MSSSSQVLVLVADETHASLCVNTDGVTQLVRRIESVSPFAELKGGSDDRSSTRHVFACELMMALGRYTREQNCDGVLIFAAAQLLDELRRVQTRNIANLMIGQFVGQPFELDAFFNQFSKPASVTSGAHS